MFQRRQRKFRRRPDNRGGMSHGSNNVITKLRSPSFSNGQSRNKFRSSLSAEQLFEKYNSLAKEAMSSGDKTLSENYLQHADHFARIIDDRNRNREQNKISSLNKSPEDKNSTPENNTVKHEEINNTEE